MTRGVRASLAILLPVAVALAALVAACSKHDGDEADAGAGVDAGFDARISDAPHDTRQEEQLAYWADAGRFCGDRDLPDCPMQAWMKRYATTMIGFGEISAIADVFDQIVKQVPDQVTMDGRPVYGNWVSIARDGASAARAGDIPAAKAACRGCHTQYQRTYHRDLRAKPVPP